MENTTNEEFDLGEIIQVLFKHIWVIAALMLLGLVAAVLVNVLMRPVYEATTLMMINKENAGKLDVNAYGSFTAEEDYYRTQYQLLESRSLLENVYKQLDLNQYDEFANPGGLGKLKKALTIAPKAPPITTPTVMLIVAHKNDNAIEILAPSQIWFQTD